MNQSSGQPRSSLMPHEPHDDSNCIHSEFRILRLRFGFNSADSADLDDVASLTGQCGSAGFGML